MLRNVFIVLILCICCAGKAQVKSSEAKQLTRILFIYDASNSMWGDWQSDKKVKIATRLLSRMVDSLSVYPDLEVALRVYGHQKDFSLHDCLDSRLEVPFAPNNFGKIKQKLKTIYPKGTTPISLSLLASERDFPPCGNCRNIIILITDGIEECGGDPCAVSQSLQRKGIILKPFIIGIGENFGTAFDCVGTYIDGSSEYDFGNALQIILNQIFNATSCQIDLLNDKGLPIESNVNMTFYNSFTKAIHYNFIHTLNQQKRPDTLYINPMTEYDIVIHTSPPIKIENINLKQGKHTVIAANAAQGELLFKLTTQKTNRYDHIPIIIRQKDSQQIVNIQYVNLKEKYLTGKYDVEILSLPRLYFKDVEIKPGLTTQIRIPNPGVAVITKPETGYGSLYLVNGKGKDAQIEWISNLRKDDTKELILLQPGSYMIVYRKENEHKTIQTYSHTFYIKSDAETMVSIPR